MVAVVQPDCNRWAPTGNYGNARRRRPTDRPTRGRPDPTSASGAVGHVMASHGSCPEIHGERERFPSPSLSSSSTSISTPDSGPLLPARTVPTSPSIIACGHRAAPDGGASSIAGGPRIRPPAPRGPRMWAAGRGGNGRNASQSIRPAADPTCRTAPRATCQFLFLRRVAMVTEIYKLARYETSGGGSSGGAFRSAAPLVLSALCAGPTGAPVPGMP